MPIIRRSSSTPALACIPLLLTAVGLPLPARADASSEADHLGDLPVVLSATRLAQVQSDAPGAVSIIDRAMISASGARNIHELFRLVPGFQVGMHTGNKPLVGYHGLSDEAPRRMLVQVDGRSVYSPYFTAGVEWNQIGVDIDDIERIEVFRGSNSATYGSNAFLGVANIITRAPAETLGTRVRYRAGDGGVNDIGLRVGRQLGDVAMRLSVARNFDHGFAGLNDWRKTELATLHSRWTADSDNSVEFQAGWTRSELGTGKEGNLTDPERSSQVSTSFGLIHWHHAPAPGEELSVSYYHQEENGRDNFDLLIPVSPRQSGLRFALQLPLRFDYDFHVIRDVTGISRL